MEASHPKYRPGQVWKYRTRPVEPDSRATVLRVDSTPELGFIIHIAVDGLSIQSPQNQDGVARNISHLPFSEAAIDESLTELERTGPVPDFREGYQSWRDGFDQQKAGIWTAPVAEAIAAMESILNAGK